MKLLDVNLLVYAHREDAPEHSRYHRWLLGALAVETGCEWISADRGFSRYPGLKWAHPFQMS